MRSSSQSKEHLHEKSSRMEVVTLVLHPSTQLQSKRAMMSPQEAHIFSKHR